MFPKNLRIKYPYQLFKICCREKKSNKFVGFVARTEGSVFDPFLEIIQCLTNKV